MTHTEVGEERLVTKIDALLPQTQCRQCGFSGCKPYAYAIAEGKAEINQCPPGGDKGIRQLAALLGREYQPLNPLHGLEKARKLAFIEENYCIGCTLCIQACPVDAIIGAAKQMHTIVAEWCTGCELCVPPCPMDCISMLPLTAPETDGHREDSRFETIGTSVRDSRADAARERHEYRKFREQREREEKADKLNGKSEQTPSSPQLTEAQERKQALIAAAVARAQWQKSRVKPANTSQLSVQQLAKIAEIEARRK